MDEPEAHDALQACLAEARLQMAGLRAESDVTRVPAALEGATELPRQSRAKASQKPPSVKTLQLLRSLTSLWHWWRVRREADMGRMDDRGPKWAQLHDFVEYTASTRRSRCLLMTEGRLGLGESQLLLNVTLLFKHVLPTLYPQMVNVSDGGMGAGCYRKLREDLSSTVRALFSEGAILQLSHAVAAKGEIRALEQLVDERVRNAAQIVCTRAQQRAKEAGKDVREAELAGMQAQIAALRSKVPIEAQEAAQIGGELAGRAAAEARRAQTQKPSTRIHAAEADVRMARDVLGVEALRRNRSLVSDAFMGLCECAGSRPTTAANTGADYVDKLLFWANRKAMKVGDLSIDPVGLNSGEGILIGGRVY